MDTAEITALINANIVDNTTKLITPVKTREVLHALNEKDIVELTFSTGLTKTGNNVALGGTYGNADESIIITGINNKSLQIRTGNGATYAASTLKSSITNAPNSTTIAASGPGGTSSAINVGSNVVSIDSNGPNPIILTQRDTSNNVRGSISIASSGDPQTIMTYSSADGSIVSTVAANPSGVIVDTQGGGTFKITPQPAAAAPGYRMLTIDEDGNVGSTEEIVVEGEKETVGKTYNKNSWSDLSDFAVNTAGVTVVGGKLNLPNGGVTDFSKSLQLNSYTNVNHWKVQAEFVLNDTISSTTTGLSLGIQSTNVNAACSIAVYFRTANTNTGRMEFFAQANGGSWTSIDASAPALTMTTGDRVRFSMERINQQIILRAENLTQIVANVHYEIVMPFDNIFVIPPNNGRFALYSQGGNFTINELIVWNNEMKNPDILLLGDSKTLGYGATSFYTTYPGLLGKLYSNVTTCAGFGDKTSDMLLHINEVITINPKQVILSIGSNDIRFGVSNATFQANYTSIVNQLTTAGIEVIHLSPTYETAQDNSAQLAWITTTFSPVVDIYRLARTTGNLYSDGIHWSTLMNRDVVKYILASNLLKSVKVDQEFYPPIPYIPSAVDFVQNQIATSQNAGYYINQPSKIEFLTDTTGNAPGALEVYRTTVNPTIKAFQGVRSVFKAYNTEAGHEDKELTSVYGGLHITSANTNNFTNATEGLIAVAGTASTLGGSGSVTLMSCFGALGGNAPTGSVTINKFCFYKVTSYDYNSNSGKVANIAGFAQPKLTVPGTTAQIQWLSGIGDATTSGGMLGNATWPTGNWNMYDASGYSNYLSGTTLVATLTDDTTSKLQVGGTTRTSKVVGGTVITDTLSLQNYTSGTTGAVLDQYGLTVGGGTASSNTLFKATRAFVDPTGNVHGFRAEHSTAYTVADTNNAMFGGFFIPTIAATNTKNWTNGTAIQGISVTPTITNGATGTVGGIVAGTFDLNFRAPGVTVTNAMGIRVYVDPLTTSTMTNVTLLGIGSSGLVSGTWSLYNESTYPSYLGTANVLVNTTTDSGTGAKLQVNGAIEGTQGRLIGATTPQLRVGFDSTHYMDANVASNGTTTFTLTGSSSPLFQFNSRVNLIAGFATNTTTNSSNVQVPAAVTNATDPRFLVTGGSSSTMFRAAFSGLSSDVAPLNSDITNVIIPRNNVTTQAASTNATMSSLLVMPSTLVSGQAPTLGAAVIIDSPTTTAVENHSLVVKTGSTKFGGGVLLPIRTVTGDTTMTASDYTLIVNNGATDAVITLPAHRAGSIFVIKRLSTTNIVTINPPSGQIDGSASFVINTANASFTFQSDGTNYYII